MKIGIAADHAGLEQKQNIVSLLKSNGYQVIDYGADEFIPDDDYPDIIAPLAKAIQNQEVNRGIAVCGSGVGVSIAANKFAGVRAALVSETYSAHQGVEHDDMNLICVGGRVLGTSLIWELLQAFLQAEFQGEERFSRRLQKVLKLEKDNFK
ncbi:RpiB/LacA/LacB family sugar-phosphate isomerase [Neptunitalea lumnitzerae]|uniref:Ribose-5-phosphate isomerase n=1 Tax=Neptunitalea lumnitzerae TaxID=2965509 RepID=A0ABQ5ME83_9FLAO|nr:RpiB/LacA/LacB family sugar-phosphate isomerase [Neptunitalea sp. Y10]GLB47646.1 ribose-5-phosphate isomerase [Neptunitalea sp. Y10]